MMTSANAVFLLTCLLLGKISQVSLSSAVNQDIGFLSVNVGENLTLRCFTDREDTQSYWYKQTLGQKPQLICYKYGFNTEGTFLGEFKNNTRFKLEGGVGVNHLSISHAQITDSASYFCLSGQLRVFQFREVITVSTKGSTLNVRALVQQSASEKVQPGQSLNLSCTVHTGSCDGEHRVYWFKSNEEHHSELFYNHRDRSVQDQDTQTKTCVHNLPMKNLNLSHTGTYYCAVASCGHILFGNGTKVEFEGDKVNMYIMGGALAFTTTLSVLMAFLLFRKNKKNCCRCSDSCAQTSVPSTTNEEAGRDDDNLHYAALSVHLPSRPRRQTDNAKNDCVYSRVRH